MSTAPHVLRSLAASLVCALLAFCASCAAEQQGALYMHPNLDLATYPRVAVLPLENLTSERFAAERVREILNVELSSQALFEVVDLGEVNRVLRTQNVGNTSELGAAQTSALGRELGVQGLMLGSVVEYQERRSGSLALPEVALSLRMLDAESGITVWAVTGARSGAKWTTRLFGIGEESQTDAVLRLVREVLSTFE
ncbi:MAG: hypothetical protein IT454_07440 [Planctomycetes bacterium]|nr:hypothetical protein [Planctomycetota bacterium]